MKEKKGLESLLLGCTLRSEKLTLCFIIDNYLLSFNSSLHDLESCVTDYGAWKLYPIVCLHVKGKRKFHFWAYSKIGIPLWKCRQSKNNEIKEW